jgi:23S rRNA pseudouridine1911/1915/1917 synthase
MPTQDNQSFYLTIDESIAGLRLDKALAKHPKLESRSQAAKLINDGHVTLDKKTVKPSYITTLNEIFFVQPVAVKSDPLAPLDLKLDIVFEDDDLIIVNKPAGLVVHPAAGHYQDTLVNALLHHTNQLSSGSEVTRPGIVHRIDKDTSGLLVVAKNDTAHRLLAKQFKEKSVHRVYWAIAYGSFKKPTQRIESLLQRHPTDRKKFSSQSKGRTAVTHYEVIKSVSSGLTLVHLKLETGRTHQIRVHLSELGHAIVADPIYSSSGRSKSIRSTQTRKVVDSIPRLCLHAAELGFIHPRTHKPMIFTSVWPDDLAPYVETLFYSKER